MSTTEPGWELYRTLLAVLEEGSLSGAGRSLGIAQPTAGRHIEALESALNTRLFLRTPTGLSPTRAALALRPYAESLNATVASLLRAASASRDRPRGTVRISASEVVGVELLPGILADFCAQEPGIDIEVSLTNRVEDLLQRHADIAIRMTAPTQGSLVARHIGDVPLGLYAHRSYLERHGIPTCLEDLQNHRGIGINQRTPFVRATLSKYPELAALPMTLRADNQVAQLALLRAGCGIGFCQRGIASQDDALIPLLAKEVSIPLTIWVVIHEDLRDTPACRAVFDALVVGLKPYTE